MRRVYSIGQLRAHCLFYTIIWEYNYIFPFNNDLVANLYYMYFYTRRNLSNLLSIIYYVYTIVKNHKLRVVRKTQMGRIHIWFKDLCLSSGYDIFGSLTIPKYNVYTINHSTKIAKNEFFFSCSQYNLLLR